MKNTLTTEEAYKAMFLFIKQYYDRCGKPKELRNLLSDMQLLESEITADPASWYDWLKTVDKILQNN